MRRLIWVGMLAACQRAPVDDTTDTADTGTDDVGTDTVDTGPDTGLAGGTGDTAPTDTGTRRITVSGTTLCIEGYDTGGEVVHGGAATPREIRVLEGRGIECQPLLGTDCTYTPAYYSPLAEGLVGKDGSFELSFDARPLEGLWLFSDTVPQGTIGVCGNGLQYTERPLTELDQENGGLTGITVGVSSIYH